MGMVRWTPVILLALLGAALLLAACSTGPAVVCSKPYILKGTECCLDANGNGICDSDEGYTLSAGANASCPAQDCSLCPATVIERNKTITVTKYVCAKTLEEVADPQECNVSVTNAFTGYVPLNASNGTVIQDFTVRPACRDSFHSVEIHFTTGTLSPNVTVQVKDSPAAEWQDAYTYTGGGTDQYLYGVFCEGQCTTSGDFFLPPKAYAMRLRFDYTQVYGDIQYSAEQVVDATTEGPFMTKLC